MQAYSDPRRENDPYALPNVEVFYHDGTDTLESDAPDAEPLPEGWYWWPCFPGCMPDGAPEGPFASEAEALADAQDEDLSDEDDETAE